jgi:O-antigen/teichoic acid export membrane protein
LAPASNWKLELSVITAGQVLAALALLTLTRYFAFSLEPTAFGTLTVYLTAANFISGCFYSPATQALLRFTSGDELSSEAIRASNRIRRYIKTCIGVSVIICVATVVLGQQQRNGLDLRSAFGIVLVISTSCFQGTSSYFDARLAAARRRVPSAVSQVAQATLRVPACLWAVQTLGPNAESALLGYVISIGLTLPYQLYAVLQIRRPMLSDRVSSVGTVSVAKYSWPFSVYFIFGWIQQNAERFAIDHFLSRADIAYYQVIYQVTYYPLNFLSGSLGKFLEPIIFSGKGYSFRDLSALGGPRSGLLIALSVVASLGILLGVGPLVTILAPPAYHKFVHLAPLFLISGSTFLIAQLFVLPILARNATVPLLVAKVASPLVAAALVAFGGFRWGAAGIAVASVAGNLLYMALVVVTLRWCLLTVDKQSVVRRQMLNDGQQ